MEKPVITCKNCGNQFSGKYCNTCGEKVYSSKDRTLASIFGEVFHFITHFDGTFFTTVKTFFTRPGKMSYDYVNGVRKKYFKPVSFFLLMVIAYLLFFPRFAGLNMKFSTYVSEQYDFQWYAAPLARQKIKSHKISGLELEKIYDSKSPAIAKVGLLLFIPLCAIVFSFIFYTSRRYFFDHFILATEIMSFYIFVNFLFLPMFSTVLIKIAPSSAHLFSDDSWLWRTFFAVFGLFTVIAFRHFYHQRWWLSTLKGMVFLIIFAACIRQIFNVLLYYLVMLFI